jgi:hypothetical protein
MLTFLPLLLVFLIFVLVEFLSRSRMNIGNQWLLLVLSVVLTWGAMLALRTRFPAPVTIGNWLPVQGVDGSLTFQLDEKSWTMAFALLSLLLGIVAADTIRLHERTNVRVWSRVLLLFCLGILGCLLNSLLAFILVWTVIDVIELIVHAVDNKDEVMNAQFIRAFLTHLVGTFLVMAVMASGHVHGASLESAKLSSTDFVLLILGAGLRMVVFPRGNQLAKRDTVAIYGEILRKAISPILAMMLLARLPGNGEWPVLMGWIFVFCAFWVFFSALNWFINLKAVWQEDSWISIFAGLAIIAALRGQADGVVAWGLLMLVLWGWSQVFAGRFQNLVYLLPVAGLSILGLPLSISNPSFVGLAGQPLAAFNIFLWVSLALVIAGFVILALKTPSQNEQPEAWMKLFFIFGMVVLTLAPWLPGFLNAGSFLSPKMLWLSLIISLVAGLILIFTFVAKAKQWLSVAIPFQMVNAAQKVHVATEGWFRMAWANRFIQNLIEFIRKLVAGVNKVLEGEGGILWALVFLALLLSLLIGSVSG